METKPMTTNDINTILQKDYFTKFNFLGVFPRDEIPAITFYPSCFVINTEPSYKKGEHWLALFFNKSRNCTFFDSYGHDPAYFNMLNYIKRFSSEFTYNKKQIQGILSVTCGHYCVFFILLMNRGYSLSTILSCFSSKNFDLNDFNTVKP